MIKDKRKDIKGKENFCLTQKISTVVMRKLSALIKPLTCHFDILVLCVMSRMKLKLNFLFRLHNIGF